jgi:hypothetical protein
MTAFIGPAIARTKSRACCQCEILYTKNTSVQVATGAMLTALKHPVTPDDPDRDGNKYKRAGRFNNSVL